MKTLNGGLACIGVVRLRGCSSRDPPTVGLETVDDMA